MKKEQIRRILDTSVLPYVSKPGRYLGNEINVIHKDPSRIDLRFLIAFPDLYELGMSSQAIGSLYHLLNQIEFVWAERVFAPWGDLEEKLRQYQVPLFSLESFTPLPEFDVIGFTLQYELTYTNILNMLDLSGLPLWSHQRQDHHPLIIGGGPGTSNPEPLAPFFDAFYIGDAEAGLDEVCTFLRECKRQMLGRRDVLKRMAQLRGIYVPALYEASYTPTGRFNGLRPLHPEIPSIIHTRLVSTLENKHYSTRPLVPLVEITHNRLAIEIMRGCTEGCRFCNAGMVYRPTRERSVEDLSEFTRQSLDQSGFDEVSLLSLSTSDYSRLSRLLRTQNQILADRQVNISFPSLRLDSFSAEIAEFASSVRKSGFTFAPEAGSERLRRVINKNITETDLLRAVEIALSNGWKTLKFYFMIGLPTETEEDIRAIAELVLEVLRVSKKYGHIELHVSLSPLIPKAHTPFQWEKQDTKAEFLTKIDLVRSLLRPYKRIKLNWRDAQVAEIECALGRGDRQLAAVIHSAWKRGSRFDGWNDLFHYENWVDAFRENDLSVQSYLHTLPGSEPLPWDHIDKGITRNFLQAERAKAMQGLVTKDCKEDNCHGCGLERKGTFRELVTCYHKENREGTEHPAAAVDQPPAEIRLPFPARDKKENGERTTIRVHFNKSGYARFISHLDLIRLLDRTLRRTGVRAAYSKGFNPRPKLSFSPALALGYTSSAEYFDLELAEDPGEDLIKRLNSVLPEGLTIAEIRTIGTRVPSLQSCINTLVYRIDLKERPVDEKDLSDLLNQKNLYISRIMKGREQPVDIKPFIESVMTEGGSLRIQLASREGRTARIEEILRYIFKSTGKQIPYLPVHRQGQFIRVENHYYTPMEII